MFPSEMRNIPTLNRHIKVFFIIYVLYIAQYLVVVWRKIILLISLM